MDSNHLKAENEAVTLPFVMSHLPDFVVKQAEEELNETAENKTRCLEELKELIKDNKATGDIDFLDDFLRQFLRQMKYNVPKASERIQNYVSMRTKYPSYFQAMQSDEFNKILSSGFSSFSPRRCRDGCAIYIHRLGNLNPSTMSIAEVWRYMIMLYSESNRDPVTQVCGYKTIYVCKNASPRLLLQYTPNQAWFLYNTFLHCIPGRYKEFHVVGESFVFKTSWLFLKNFLSDKIRKRFFFHSDPEKLLDHFPRSVLPEDLGGDCKDCFMSEWIQGANEQYREYTPRGQPNYF